MHKKISCLLLICFCLAIVGPAFHHHNDGVPHEDCSICFYVLHHPNLVIQEFSQTSPQDFYTLLISLESTADLPSRYFSVYSSRAPPA